MKRSHGAAASIAAILGLTLTGCSGSWLGITSAQSPSAIQDSVAPGLSISAPATNPATAPGTSLSPTPTLAPTPKCTTTSDPNGVIPLGRYDVRSTGYNITGTKPSQTVTACTPNKFQALISVDDIGTGLGVATAYPSISQSINQTIGSFAQVTVNFAHSVNRSDARYDFDFDTWLFGTNDSNQAMQVEIWTQAVNVKPYGKFTTTFHDAASGITYDVYRDSSPYVAFFPHTNRTSGTINATGFYKFLVDSGWILATAPVKRMEYGPEVLTTHNVPTIFAVTDFTLATK